MEVRRGAEIVAPPISIADFPVWHYLCFELKFTIGVTSMQTDTHQMQAMLAAMAGFYLVFYLIQAAIFMIPAWFIAKKAGFSPWLSMLCIFPLTGVVFFYVLAFAEWKVVPAAQLVPYPPPYQPPYPPAPPTA
jgi:hypothetical protein